MPFLRCVGVSFAYTDALPLFVDLNLHLAPGWIGVVGPNGAGKTTLLRLIAGELEPDRGHLSLHPPGVRTVLCPQTVEERGWLIDDFAESPEPAASRLREELRLRPIDLTRWATLSPGERKRWQIGAALSTEPLVLLLDEPTNHLDSVARDLLLRALARFQGIGLVVSHDRAVLDRLTTSTVRLHQGTVRLWRGGYHAAQASWEAEERDRQAAYARVRGQERALRRRLADTRRSRAAAEARSKSQTMIKSFRDQDGIGKKAKARAGAARLSHDISVIRRKVERTAAEAHSYKFEKLPGGSIFIDYLRAPMARLLSLHASTVRVGKRTLLEDVHLTVGRESRIRLAGPNGCGKSTLLAALLSQSRVPASKLLYLPQEMSAREELALLDSVRALPAGERGRVLSLVAALGADPGVLLESQRLSPGQARKLLMAYGLGRHVWGVLLDEPTNHLDLPSVQRLEDALASYPGALVLITHDDYFARHCTATTWQVRDGTVLVQ